MKLRLAARELLFALFFLGYGLIYFGYAENFDLLKLKAVTPAALEYNKGVDNFVTGDLASAEAQFKKSLDLDSGMVSALLGLSEIAHKKGKIDEAGGYLQKAIGVAPQVPEVQRAWARYLYIKNDYRGSEAALQKALALKSTFVGALIDLGDLNLNALNAPAKAIENYRAALAIEPNN